MEVSLYIFLFIYFALLFVCLLYVLFNFYHLFRFGSLDTETVFASFLFLAILTIIIFASYQEIIKINWRQPFFSFQIPKIELEWPLNFK
ncbi:MAG: hypothetical protein N2259_01670 [Patescibacteria group bacterium]|nr:hypothetical protein [Patescibacteria group bacterium]